MQVLFFVIKHCIKVKLDVTFSYKSALSLMGQTLIIENETAFKSLLSLMLLHKRLKNVCVITLMITQQAGTKIVMK